jgi:NADPH:quinone reductase-like Zn-dependent oxidoreductase
MARVVRFYEAGGPEVLRIEDVAVRDPAPGEVRIRVEAIGLNRSDMIYRYGHHPIQPKLPSLLGSEAAGTVESIGDGVAGFAVGDAVSVVPRMAPEHGTYGELINVPAIFAIRHPPNLSMAEAAGLWSPFLTAYCGMIEAGGLGRGDLVILPAASSSVGLAAIQIANLVGAVPVATTRRRDKAQRLMDAGARDVIVTEDEDGAARLAAIAGIGEGAKLVFDPIGGPGVVQLARTMALKGIYVIYGVLSGDPTPFPVGEAFARQLTMKTFALPPDRGKLDEAIRFIGAAVERGALRPLVSSLFALEDMVEAHRFMESNRQFGKIVVTTS